ncbi:MAG TPA: SpoIID/LytB domain-containing protein [Cyanobium sp.]|nr:SpoIID/LytB domain-containing protein [Cyanobium sp.]
MSFPSPGWRAGLLLSLLPAATILHTPLEARSPEPVMRVLLQEAPFLEVAAAGSVPLSVSDGQGRALLRLPAGNRLRLRPGSTGLEAELLPVGSTQARPRPVSLPLQEAWIDPVPASGGLLVLKDRRFRGRLQVRPAGRRLQAVNHIALESYLASVVGSEMPAAWPQAALRAQAVAARTYALSQRKPLAPYDLKATVASQVYRGVEAETASTRRAVASTRSQVILQGGRLISAVFHSSSGGSTENSGEIWSKQLPYLVSVPDFDDRNPTRRWEQRFDPADLRKAFPVIAGVERIDVLETSSTGRIRRARVIGPRGMLLLRGAELRERLGLRSTLVRFRFEPAPQQALVSAAGPIPLPVLPASPSRRPFSRPLPSGGGPGEAPAPPAEPLAAPSLVASGRGFGHGVGMSQWGAYGLALRGQGHEQILRHFYRGVEVRPFTPR